MRSWVENYLTKLSATDYELYDYFIQLRAVSSHNLVVVPDRANISVQVFDQMSDMGNGGPHGNLRFQHDSGMPGAENLIQSTKISTQYFFSDRLQEDIVTSCEKVVQTLEKLVSEAYSTNP